MLAFTTHVKTLSIQATDGPIGAVADLYFDDRSREVRWVVVDTGTWLPGRKVLLPTSHVVGLDARGSALRVDVTRQRVADGPGRDFDRPVSRQMEQSVYGYYNWAPYWGAPSIAPAAYMPGAPMGVVPPAGTATQTAAPKVDGRRGARDDDDDPHLRSGNEVVGYYVEARDGSIGHVEDLLVDVIAWAVGGLVVDTKNWWPGRKVVVPADRLIDVSWGERIVQLAQSREEIKRAPDYDPGRLAALRLDPARA
jgi:uncharacterized protein YrrD